MLVENDSLTSLNKARGKGGSAVSRGAQRTIQLANLTLFNM